MSGKQQIPEIKKVMTETPITTAYDTPLRIVSEIMHDNNIRHLPVLEGRNFVGLISERDLKVAQELERAKDVSINVGEICNKDIYTVSPETPIDEVVENMAKDSLGSVVVLEHGKVIGIFTTIDLCRCYINLLNNPQ